MRSDWEDRWFLDGENATLEHGDGGLFFSGGPVTKPEDPVEYHAHHAVLWTKQSFEGDLRISYDMTRVDTSDYGNTLLYVQAQGIGEGPWAKDIGEWSEKRTVPEMATYFTYMNLISLSFRDTLRCKRYPYSDADGNRLRSRGEIRPRADYIGIIPGKTYRVVVEKKAESFRIQLFDSQTGESYVDNTWDLTDIDDSVEPRIVSEGRIGLRHMASKQFIYKDFKVEQL